MPWRIPKKKKEKRKKKKKTGIQGRVFPTCADVIAASISLNDLEALITPDSTRSRASAAVASSLSIAVLSFFSCCSAISVAAETAALATVDAPRSVIDPFIAAAIILPFSISDCWAAASAAAIP